MANEQFKKGDVVELKSGGPDMTVVGDDRSDNSVMCAWFNTGGGNYEVKQALFPLASLKPKNR